MGEFDAADFATRLCKTAGCENELTGSDPARGRHANMCRRCRTEGPPLITEPLAPPVERDEHGLTVADHGLLFAIADGVTQERVAAECGVTSQAIAARIVVLRRRLGARTDAQLVALAYHRRILVAPPARR